MRTASLSNEGSFMTVTGGVRQTWTFRRQNIEMLLMRLIFMHLHLALPFQIQIIIPLFFVEMFDGITQHDTRHGGGVFI